jgi:hypothetical protein
VASGLQLTFTALKAQLGELLNGIVINENYVPEPTMKFLGVDQVLLQYQEKAKVPASIPWDFGHRWLLPSCRCWRRRSMRLARSIKN